MDVGIFGTIVFTSYVDGAYEYYKTFKMVRYITRSEIKPYIIEQDVSRN